MAFVFTCPNKGCVPFGESKNGFLIQDLPDLAVERNAKSEIGSVTLVTVPCETEVLLVSRREERARNLCLAGYGNCRKCFQYQMAASEKMMQFLLFDDLMR